MDAQSYTIDHRSISAERLKLALLNENFKAAAKEEKWVKLIKKLPQGLQSALLIELKLGNYVNSLQYANWPQKGSILVSLGMSFKFDFTDNELDVKKRILGDPHYWSQDLHQVVDGVEYLIIC